MSEKVKLTREQAEAIDGIKASNLGNDGAILEFVRAFGISNHIFHLDEIIKALYIGYEVEEKFEVGDCVVLDDGKIAEILSAWQCDDKFLVGWIANGSMYKEYVNGNRIIRHATKQEKWWASHGRKVWQLKINDEIWHRDSDKRYDVIFIFDNGDINMESTSANDFGQKEVVTVKKSYISNYYYNVICFAEDRKDVW